MKHMKRLTVQKKNSAFVMKKKRGTHALT